MPPEISKRKRLTAGEKANLVDALRGGKSRDSLAAQYGVHPTTISKILKVNAATPYSELIDNGLSLTRKSTKKPLNEELDSKLSDWVIDQTSHGIYLQRLDITTKAAVIASELGLTDFKASPGYFSKFCKHDGYT